MRRHLTLLCCATVWASLGLFTPRSSAQDTGGDPPDSSGQEPDPPVIKPFRNLRAGFTPHTLYAGTPADLAAANAHVDRSVIGTSAGGREIELLTVRALRDGAPEPDAAVQWKALLVAGLSGLRDRAETRLALDVASELASRAADFPPGVAFEVLVDGNPDATASAAAGLVRAGNDTPTDEDQDGDVDEDGGEDLSGDGLVTWMRFPDPTGQLSVAPRDPATEEPELPVWADPEKGKARTHRIVPEGRDSDDDGAWNEDGPGGVDLSRNFPWRFEELTPGRGRWAASEPETRALIDHLLADERVALVYEFGDAETVSKEPGNNDAWPKPPGDDAKLYAALRELHGPGVKDLKRDPHTPEPGSLGSVVAHQLGRIYVGRAPLGMSGAPWPAPGAELPDYLAVRWTPLTVSGVPRGAEVGVIVPAPDKQAPPLAAESDAATAFLIDVAGGRAALSFEDTRVSGEPGVVRFRTKIVNTGRLPTHTERGAEVRGRRPVNVWLRAPLGCTLLGGDVHTKLERIGAGAASDELKYVVKGPSGTIVRVEVVTPDAGTTTLEVRIP